MSAHQSNLLSILVGSADGAVPQTNDHSEPHGREEEEEGGEEGTEEEGVEKDTEDEEGEEDTEGEEDESGEAGNEDVGDEGDSNPNAGWAEAMAKIIGRKTEDAQSSILMKNRELEKVKEKERQEYLEKKKQVSGLCDPDRLCSNL